MKKCPYCGAANSGAFLNCTECNSPLTKAKTIIVEEMPKPKKQPRPRKEPEYVQLHHGPRVKKSTAKYLARKDKATMQWVWGYFVIIALLGILSRCS